MSTEPILLIVSDRAPEELALGPLLEGLGALVECVPCDQLSSAFSVVGPDLVLHWGLARADATAAFLMSQPERDRVQLILLGERSDLAAMRKVRPDLVVAVLAEDIAAQLLAERVMSMAERAARRYGSTPPQADVLPPRPRLPSISDEDERPTEPIDLGVPTARAPVSPPSAPAATQSPAGGAPATSAPPLISAAAPPSKVPAALPYPALPPGVVSTAPGEGAPRFPPPSVPSSGSASSLQGLATGARTISPPSRPETARASGKKLWVWALAALVPVAGAGWLFARGPVGAAPVLQGPSEPQGARQAAPQSAAPGSGKGLGQAKPDGGQATVAENDPWIRRENPRVLECEALVSTDLSLRKGDADQANLFWQRARERLLLGDLQGAYLELCRTVTVNAGSQIAEALAEHLLTMGAPAHAERWAKEAVRLRPGRPKALELTGDVLSQKGQPVAAREAWLSALSIRSLDEAAARSLSQHWEELGRDAHRTGNAGLAERLYRRAATVDPKNADALVGLGRIAHERGEVALARAWLERAIAAGGESPQVNALRTALQTGKPIPLATRSSARPRKEEGSAPTPVAGEPPEGDSSGASSPSVPATQPLVEPSPAAPVAP